MEGLSVWTDARWRAGFAAWVDDALRAAGERCVAEPDEVHLRPWSVVWRLETDGGVRFAKAGASSQRCEPGLIAHLAALDPTLVPELLARDEARGWSITVDGGHRARDLDDRDAVLATLAAALPRYAELQRAAAPTTDRMLTLGVPDMRHDAVVASLAALLVAPRHLVGGGDDTLTDAEVAELRAHLPGFAAAVGRLAGGPVPPSIEHGDLHDANVYVDRGGRVFDWGDATIAHPFTSLLIVDVALENRFELLTDSPEARRLHRAYLQAWSDLASIDELERLARDAMGLGGAQKALGWVRMLSVMPADEVAEWRDAPAIWLRELLGVLRRLDAG